MLLFRQIKNSSPYRPRGLKMGTQYSTRCGKHCFNLVWLIYPYFPRGFFVSHLHDNPSTTSQCDFTGGSLTKIMNTIDEVDIITLTRRIKMMTRNSLSLFVPHLKSNVKYFTLRVETRNKFCSFPLCFQSCHGRQEMVGLANICK